MRELNEKEIEQITGGAIDLSGIIDSISKIPLIGGCIGGILSRLFGGGGTTPPTTP